MRSTTAVSIPTSFQDPETIQSHDVLLNGAKVHYLAAGHGGPTIVILSSMLVMARSYRKLLRTIAPDSRVLVVDLPGAGVSSAHGKVWTVESYALWLNDFLNALGIKSPLVIGHSNSGAVAIRFARLYPENVKGIILADTVGLAPAKSIARAMIRRTVDGIYELPLSLSHWHHILWNVVFHPRNFWEQVKIASYIDLRDEIGEVRVPTLFAWGQRDCSMPMLPSLQAASSLPQGHYLTSRGSHDWILTRPKEFFKGIRVWFHSAKIS